MYNSFIYTPQSKMRFLTAIATLLPLVFGFNRIPHVLNSDVLHHELRSWYVDHPHQPPYPPIKGITAYENALITGPLGDILLPTTEQVVYPLVSQPQMPFDVLFNRTHQNREREHHDKLYSAVHSYSFMTFHFMYEIIPKIAEGLPLLKANPNIKLLVWQNANLTLSMYPAIFQRATVRLRTNTSFSWP
jgi:hypothetical protein